ncbi:MAG: SUMF1/EgtB/PvdO family nonheme iron enzyme [Candidatus Alcyoniella australis]|nr:SUMF1/EgtB/PvdO family nonheme iron enzyme [Candidatus Alcyoniella australis]
MDNPIRTFISYAYEKDKEYLIWVRQLAARLRQDGIDARIDAWNLQGSTITEFMQREVRNADKVLVLCSPAYRKKVHDMEDGERVTGVGWESMLISSEIFSTNCRNKLIAALTRGGWRLSAPDFLIGWPFHDLSSPKTFEDNYRQLLIDLVVGPTLPSMGNTPPGLREDTEIKPLMVDKSSVALPTTWDKTIYPEAGLLRKNIKDGTVFVYISTSSVQLGSSLGQLRSGNWKPNERIPDESIPHTASIDGFWFARTPITNKQYKLFCQDTGYELPQRLDDVCFNGDEHPVIGVSWYDANEYLNWAGLRFPTEAEWERVAVGLENRLFPWGNELPTFEYANFGANRPGTTPVSQHFRGATPENILDMAGNVLEWCADDTREYAPGRIDNPIGSLSNELCALRGGSFKRLANEIRSRYRDRRSKKSTWGSSGIRAAIDEEAL